MKKTKNIKIDEQLHKELKIYCAINDLKITEFIEKLVKKNIVKDVAK